MAKGDVTSMNWNGENEILCVYLGPAIIQKRRRICRFHAGFQLFLFYGIGNILLIRWGIYRLGQVHGHSVSVNIPNRTDTVKPQKKEHFFFLPVTSSCG